MKKIVLLSLFLSALFFGCLQQGAPQESVITSNYSATVQVANASPSLNASPSNESGSQAGKQAFTRFDAPEFSLDYPPELSFEEKAFFTSPNESDGDGFQELFTVKTWETGETLDDLEVNEKGYIGDDANFTNITRAVFREREALLLEGEFPPASNKSKGERFTTIFFKQGQRVFRLRYTIEKGKEAIYQPIVERMKDSLQLPPVASASSSEGYSKYNSSRFSIDYPSAWVVEKPDSFRFVSSKENSSDKVVEELIVEVAESNKTFDELEQEEKALLWEGEEISSIQRAQFKGYDASFIEYDGALYPGSVEQQHFKTIVFRKQGKVYRLQYVFEKAEGKKEKYAPLFEKILETFEAK